MRTARRLALIAAAVLAAQPALAAPAKAHRPKAGAAAKAPQDMTLGSPKAKVQVVEYASLSCPHCAKFNDEVFPAFRAKYVDSGQVRYTLREVLTPPAEVAAAGFMLARCAAKGDPIVYFKVVDEVFKSQSRWAASEGSLKPIFVEIAKAHGLSEPQLDACVGDKDGLQALRGRVQAAVDAGVDATPTFFVDGKKVAEGEMTLPQLDAAIAKAKTQKTGG